MLNPSIPIPQYPGLDSALIARGFPPLTAPNVPTDVFIGRIVSKAILVTPGDPAMDVDLTAAAAWEGDPRFLKFLGQSPESGTNPANYAMRGVIVGARVPFYGASGVALEYTLPAMAQLTSGTGVWFESGAIVSGTPSQRLKAYNAAITTSALSDINGAGYSQNSPDLDIFTDPLYVDFQSSFRLRSREWAGAVGDAMNIRVDALVLFWKSNPVDPTNSNEPCQPASDDAIQGATLSTKLRQLAVQLHAASLG